MPFVQWAWLEASLLGVVCVRVNEARTPSQDGAFPPRVTTLFVNGAGLVALITVVVALGMQLTGILFDFFFDMAQAISTVCHIDHGWIMFCCIPVFLLI